MKRILIILALLASLFLAPLSASAQSYFFQLSELTVDVYWNADGSSELDYTFVFDNDFSGASIEYVDVGLPNKSYDEASITAEVNGNDVSYISSSEYEGDGTGVAVALGSGSIPPGERGTVHVHIARIDGVLRPDSDNQDYASAVFSPTWFAKESSYGPTAITVTYHFPVGVQPDEPRWHTSPAGFPEEPTTGFDSQDRITYTWSNPSAVPYEQYLFGASFPRTYVPESAVKSLTFWEMLGTSPEEIMPFAFVLCIGAFIVFFIVLGFRSSEKRRLQYLPPKISIEGHGIKRGLTAIEAAILLEQPLDKILTMTLFAVIKKNAASVVTKDPLKLQVTDPLPEELAAYEKGFLTAMAQDSLSARRKELQDMVIELVRSVSEKMRGFSRKESIAYYKAIVERAWEQVTAAGTPEVKSQKFDEVMEWTMLDNDYDRRTRDVFRTGPVYIPTWWGRYDPGFGRTATIGRTGGGPMPASTTTTGGGGGVSLPTLPGSDFAASMVNSVQSFSAGVVGNLTEFTSRVTNKTNPVPVATSSGPSRSGGTRSGGGCACACACACAGCACACAGGGR